MSEKFFSKVYQTHGPQANRELYDDWSKSYEDEVSAQGYATPGRIAAALSGVLPDKTVRILDYGCGTGLSGTALKSEGFTNVVGMDPSEGMLAQCPDGLYRQKIQLDLDAPPPISQAEYRVIMAVGVISTGAGPASLMDDLMNYLPKGGLFGLSLNDHALDDPDYPAGIESLKAAGHKTLIEDYGDHLPGLDVKSMIYIIEKA